MNLTIVSPIPPSVNNYLNYRVQKNPHNGKVFVQAYKPAETIKFENKLKKIVKEEIKKQDWAMPDPDKYIYLDCIFYFPKHGMDTNNHWKVPLDVLKECKVYHDDSKVIEKAHRLYIDSNEPRMVISLELAPWIGIFADQEDLNNFKEKNCFNCKKKFDRCSTMTKALQNRLTGDITIETNTCNVIKVKNK